MADAGSASLGMSSSLVAQHRSVTLAVEADDNSIFVGTMTGKKSSPSGAVAEH